MMPTNDPWQAIDPVTPSGQINARRSDAAHPHDFFWALDAQGHRMLVLQSANLDTTKSLPSLRGIVLELGSDRFSLRLVDNKDLEIFSTLCWSLIERTRTTRPGSDVLECILTQLMRWQRFLSKERRGLLSDQEIRGLFCELKFIESELMPRFDTDAIGFWRGPAGDPQDFAIGMTLFEVKSHLAGSLPVLMISSAEQLWHAAGDLYLVAYTIAEAAHGASDALSLAGLVARMRSLISLPDILDVFDDRLQEAGFLDHPRYAEDVFTVSSPQFFVVSGGFPRISAEVVPTGVCQLKYGIELAACLPFEQFPDWNGLGAANGR